MVKNAGGNDATPRTEARYPYAVPMIVELSNGLLRPTDRAEAILVDLSQGGAALILRADARLRVRRRYRVAIDDHAGIIEVRNIVPVDEERVRVGVAFTKLGLELQELVADSLDDAQIRASRLDPFADAAIAEVQEIA